MGNNSKNHAATAGSAGGGWFLGFIGALVYYLHFHSGTFWLVVVGIFKAIFWPAYLVYNLMVSLHM
jgi:hypothetical protein